MPRFSSVAQTVSAFTARKSNNVTTTDDRSAAFFRPLENTQPYFKAALQGFAGSGKTYTTAMIAAGLHDMIKSTKPIVIFDTERSAKFLKPFFRSRKIDVLVKESRALVDLMTAMELCGDGASDILLVDSITHIWEGFLESYKRQVKRNRLEFQDWGRIKPAWKSGFADGFVQGRFHAIITGRAGYEYEKEVTVDEETGKKHSEINKSGVKMKVEGETAYEPDVLIMMERHEDIIGDVKQVWREATVLKDRSTLIDGKTFRNPSFDQFRPVVEYLLDNPVAAVPSREGDDAELFRGDNSGDRTRTDRTILIEEIESELRERYPSQGADDKAARIRSMKECFGTSSWTYIERRADMALLAAGLAAFRHGVRNLSVSVGASVNVQPHAGATLVATGAPVTQPHDEPSTSSLIGDMST